MLIQWLRENNQEDFILGLRNGSFAQQVMSWLQHWSNDDAYRKGVLMWLNNTWYRAVATAEEAVHLTPNGHPNKPS